MGVERKIGEVKYLTYYLEFPDGDHWVDQSPIVHDIMFFLENCRFRKLPEIKRALLHKGEAHWKDHNGVGHRVVIENEKRARRWGVNKPLSYRRKH